MASTPRPGLEDYVTDNTILHHVIATNGEYDINSVQAIQNFLKNQIIENVDIETGVIQVTDDVQIA